MDIKKYVDIMKLLMLNYEFPPLGGGAANANFHILKNLATYTDLQIDLIVSSVGSYKIEQFSETIKVHYLDIGKSENLHHQTNLELLKYSIKSYNYIKHLCKYKSYDLIHAFFGIPCGFIGLLTGLPMIVSLRGSDVPGYNERFKYLDYLFFRHLSSFIWRKSAYTIANSKGLRKLAMETAKGSCIGLIPNGVDIDFWQPSRTQAREKEIFRVVSVGRLIPRKGFNFLINALVGLDIELIIAGDGPDKKALQEQADLLNVRLTLTGKLDREKIRILLQESDLFVLPSLNEGMSNAVLEAMACGLPIVMSTVGGSELINGNGRLVLKTDTKDLRKAILAYFKDEHLVKRCGERSRRLSMALSWEQVAGQYMDLYRDLLLGV